MGSCSTEVEVSHPRRHPIDSLRVILAKKAKQEGFDHLTHTISQLYEISPWHLKRYTCIQGILSWSSSLPLSLEIHQFCKDLSSKRGGDSLDLPDFNIHVCFLKHGVKSLHYRSRLKPAMLLDIVDDGSTRPSVKGKYASTLASFGRLECRKTSLTNFKASLVSIGGKIITLVRPIRSFNSGLNHSGDSPMDGQKTRGSSQALLDTR